MELLIVVLKHKIKKRSQVWSWAFLSPLILKIANQSRKIGIEEARELNLCLMVSSKENEDEKIVGTKLTNALRNKLQELFNRETETRKTLDYQTILKFNLVVISHEWNLEVLSKKSVISVISLGLKLRRSETSVWIFPVDPCNLDFVLRNSILVAIAGGAIVCQSNTGSQMSNFGLPHCVGPYIWTFGSKLEDSDFYIFMESKLRNQLCLLAGSGGDSRRETLMSNLGNYFEKELGWNIQTSKHQFSWNEYIDIVKNATIVATTSFLQEEHTRGTRILGKRVPSSVLTHRVLEGFASGSAVITTKDVCIEEMGFIDGVDYIQLENLIAPEIKLSKYLISDFMNIGRRGQENFRKYLLTQGF